MNPKLVIVADLGLLRAYKFTKTPKGSPHFDLLEQIVLEEAHHRLIEEVTDLAGRRGAPTQRNWGAPLVDAHNLQLETQRRLVKEIAGHIERLSRNHKEFGIWLATHKEVNHPILEALPRPVRERIQMSLCRDLVKTSKEELAQYFLEETQPGRGGKTARHQDRALSTKNS